ncbi:MAG: type II toxin-antitoxin system HigB family toxin [Bryobacterales bacterium]|nr:type II toxin-antitoxin system HigB family toxin [Bryobacterales bacterium]
MTFLAAATDTGTAACYLPGRVVVNQPQRLLLIRRIVYLINDFLTRHDDAEPSLINWYRITKSATWKSLVDTRNGFPHADPVGRRTIFNISGNKYRLIASVNYRTERVFILKILTHAEYDKEFKS